MRRGRWVVLRTAWLLVGAAIGLAALLLLVGLAQVLVPSTPWPLVVLFLLPVALIGLLPGVRELEVTAAVALVGVTGDLVTPEHPRAGHRWRTVAVVTYHLAAGLLAAVLLLAILPAAVALVVADVQGRRELVAGRALPQLPGAAAVLVGLAVAAAALVAVWGLGRLSVAVVGRLLGPSAHDRLEVALARLQAESEHTRLARELHDGIGHALTIIGVQAAAGRRNLSRHPEQVEPALTSIEETSRRAQEELDGMLGLLRDGLDGGGSRTPEPDLDRLPELLGTYRAAGMDLVADLAPVRALPRLVSTTGYRILAEALTNAQRYSSPGPVAVTLRQSPGLLTIEVRNRLPNATARGRRSGRGLTGIAERVALFGGSVRAGADGDEWVLLARIPTGMADA